MQTLITISAAEMYINRYIISINFQVNIVLTSRRITLSFMSDVKKNHKKIRGNDFS